METKYVIGIDFGTRSGRAILVNCADGSILASSTMDYPHGVMDETLPSGKRLEPNWVLQYPLDYLEVLETTVKDIVDNSSIPKENIIGLSTDFTACTILPVDKDLKPLCANDGYKDNPHAFVKLWKHHAAQKEADKISDLLEKEGMIQDYKYGGRISSEIMLPKILQIANEDPDVYRAADQILEAPDWIAQLLTGTRKCSGSTASYKAMWNPINGYPTKDFLRQLNLLIENLVEEKLSTDICNIGGKIGELNKEWAGRLHLSEGIAVGANIIDAHAGLVSCGVTQPGQMLLSIGTSTAQTVISTAPYSGKGLLGGVKDQIIPGYYAIESGLASVGDSLEWFVNNLTPMGYFKEAEEKYNGDIYKLLNQKAAALAPGECGLIALDWLNGNKTPYVDGNRTSAIVGLSLYTKPEDIWRAFIESTAFGTRLIMEIANEASISISEIRCCGGLAEKNPLLMQIYADVTHREMKIIASSQTAAAGSAIYAAVAAGKEKGGYDTVLDAVENMKFPISKIYTPDDEAGKVYDKLYELFMKLCTDYAPGPNDIMKTLKSLRKK